MDKNRFLLSGSGGQGVITMGILLAEAAALQQGLTAIQSQSYGPEARGGATRCDVLIDEGPIDFPKVLEANVMVCLTQAALNKYLHLLRPGGLLLTDAALVRVPARVDAEHVSLPMHEVVLEKIGRAQAFNICVLGALVHLSGVVSPEAIQRNLEVKFASNFHQANNEALKLGLALAAGR